MAYHNGMKFSTIDVDNDLSNGIDCAAGEGEKWGCWWYNACADVNLNGLYGTVSIKHAIYWIDWQTYAPMKTTSMMIKRHS